MLCQVKSYPLFLDMIKGKNWDPEFVQKTREIIQGIMLNHVLNDPELDSGSGGARAPPEGSILRK